MYVTSVLPARREYILPQTRFYPAVILYTPISFINPENNIYGSPKTLALNSKTPKKFQEISISINISLVYPIVQ